MKNFIFCFILCLFLCGCGKPSIKEIIWNFEEREGHSVEISNKKETKYFFIIRIDEEDYARWLSTYESGEEFGLTINAKVK